MKKVLLIVAALLLVGIVSIGAYLKFALPSVAKAPNLKAPIDQASIAHGRYLAHHVAVCMDCHSQRDWSRFSAPLANGPLGIGGEYFGPEMGFPGKFYSRNLTPAHLGTWTDGEIFRAVTTGVSKDGSALFPVMPYQYYAKMDKRDVLDIIAYIRTLPAAEVPIPESAPDFPMNFILNTIPKDALLGNRPDPSNKLAYGAYLVNMAACMECHTPASNGQIIPEKAFSGGREFKLPAGLLRSANITPDIETGIGGWTENDFIARFASYRSPDALPKVPEGTFNTLMPWSMYANMKDEDLSAIYEYLHSLKPVKNQVARFTENK